MADKDRQEPKTSPPLDTSFQQEYKRHQLQKINRMTISDLLKQKRTPTQPVGSHQQTTLLEQAREFNKHHKVENRYLGERTPGQLWTNLEQQTLQMKSADLYEQRISKTLNYAKRGKLGIDLYLIAFATLGLIGIPLYFYFSGKKERQRKVKSRILTPAQIKNLDEDSAVSIDDVSEQVIMYYNPERQAQRKAELMRQKEYQKILREIEQM